VIDPDALAELAASIAKYGILQPLLFRADPEGQGWLIIVAGERRYQAAEQAGLMVLPAIYVEGDYAEIALVENLQRQDLTAVEEAESLQRLMDAHAYTQEQLGGIVGKARTTVSETLTINRLPVEIRDACRGDRKIPRQTLIDIARKKQERGMISAWNAWQSKQRKVKTTRQKKTPSDPAAVLEMTQKALTKLDTLDTTAWTDDERERLRVALGALNEKIAGLLNPNPGPA
jgi:ParB family chromosome partitioning protein